MLSPEPLLIGIALHVATVAVGFRFVRRLQRENIAAHADAGHPDAKQIVWSKWPPIRYVHFLLSRRYRAFLPHSKLRREADLLFVLYCAQLICIVWFAVTAFR